MAENKIKYQGISTLEVLVEAKNYNAWIADEIRKHFESPLLELGAGTGNLTSYFVDYKNFHISEYDEGLLKHIKQKFSKYKQLTINRLDISKKPPKQYESFFSCIFAINVLEHIKNDQQALDNIYKMLKPGGKIILLIPAKKFAYTKLDKELGHFRRYEKNDLENKLLAAGYQIEKIYFFNIVGLLSWTIRDKVRRNNVHLKPYHIKIFDSIVPVLRFIEGKVRMPLGISLIAIATKK